ncbi:cation:proton antiporter [Halalkalicoccus tibetensis]|uniref:Cation:proton antiporter n=1 Tax=Halalkalicoccus tibetensis TaxID=175632 RepID=A0ABD5UXX9_9EURY
MSELLTALSVIFVVAGGLLLVANHYSLATVPFLILAGVIAGFFIDPPVLLELAQWGIAFLVFVFGVELDLGSMRTLARDAEITTTVQVGVVGALGFAAGLGLGFDATNALYFSVAAALSSTIVGAGLLQAEFRQNLVYGRLAHSVHFVQDLLAILLILVLSAETASADAVASSLGYGVVLLAAAYVINVYLFDHLSALAEGSQELLMITAISILIGFLALTELVGISIVVGAFAAGLAIKRDFTRNLGMLNGIESIKDFFVAVFFVSLGALVFLGTPDLTVLAAALVLVFLTAVVKPAVTFVAFLREGYDARTATLTSLSLDQTSEFALIMAIEAFIAGLIVPELFDAIILAAAVTMITASYTRRNDERLYGLLSRAGLPRASHRKTDQRSAVEPGLSDHVIVVGYGRQGRRLVETCERRGIDYLVVENDPTMFESLEGECRNYVFGDVMDRYTWEKAEADGASLIVSTVDQRRVSDRILSLETDADVILRSRTADEAGDLLDRGALYVNVPDLLAADRLLEHVAGVTEEPGYRERLRGKHLEELDAFEEAGFSSMSEDTDPRS